MQVELSLGHQTIIAELSGAELEVLARIMAKITKIDGEHTIGTKDYYIQSDQPMKFTAKVVNNVTLISRDVYNEMLKQEQLERRAALLQDTDSHEGMRALLRDFYYAGTVKKDEFEHMDEVQRISVAGGFVFNLEGGRHLTVKNDGSFVLE